jgi:Rod binding domain-containing protein
VSGRIQGIGAPNAAIATAAAKAAEKPSEGAKASGTKASKKAADLDMAAREFEQIFVRSMLKDTPIAGKGDAYGDLAVDALAKSVTAGRGLGLGDLIKHSVETSEKALKDRG